MSLQETVERVLALHALLDQSLEILQRAGLAEGQGDDHE